MLSPDAEKRFLDAFTPVTECGCWLWDKSTNHKGYGIFWVPSLKRMVHASRVSHVLHIGEIPKGQHVLHKCDNPICINPSHLFLGSNQDNVDDKVAKGRQHRPIGESNPKVKLNPDMVLDIRRRHLTEGASVKQMAGEYGVGYTAINKIVRRKNWSHI